MLFWQYKKRQLCKRKYRVSPQGWQIRFLAVHCLSSEPPIRAAQQEAIKMTRVYFNIPHRELVKLCKKYPGRFKQIQKRDCPIDIENRRATIQQFLESKNKTFRGSHLHVELRRLNLYTQQLQSHTLP